MLESNRITLRLLGGLLQHVVTMPPRDGHESDSLGVVADLLNEGRGFLDNFVEAVLAPLLEIHQTKFTSKECTAHLGRVHFVYSDDKLTHTEGERQKSVFTGLTVLGDTSLELAGTPSNNEDSTVSLGGTSDHVFDKITVSGGVNNLMLRVRIRLLHARMATTYSDHELGSLEFPEGDIDSNTTLTLSLELVEHPC